MQREVEQLYSVREVADLCGVDEVTVRRHQWSGALPCVRIGRSVRFRKSVVADLQAKMRGGRQ